jgi:hypothetical protein
MLAGRPPFVDQLQSAVLVKQATVAPPPLVALCKAELPRRLALVVHTLLAKSPHDRPRSADEARRMLAQSLARPTQDAPPVPFAGTIATLNTRASRASRLIAAATILAALGGLWLVWANSSAPLVIPPDAVRAATVSHNLRPAGARPAAPPATFSDAALHDAPPVNESAPTLTDQAARLIASSVVHRQIGEAHVVETERGPAIVAIHDERPTGTTHLFMLEARGTSGGYHVTGHAPLDVEDFRGAYWTAEVVDANGDGFEEVLFTGTDARNDPFSRRLVLYVPRERQTYSLRVGADGSESGAVRVKWSANAGGAHAKAYRALMREHALADLPHLKS